MPDFITLTCPSCGGKLQITNDMDRFACAYCGTEHIVRRGGGVISLAPVVEGLKKVEIGVDKTASELALNRLKQEIVEIEAKTNLIRNTNYPNSFFQALAAVAVVLGGLMTLVFLIMYLTDTTSPSGGLFFSLLILVTAIVILLFTNRGAKDFDQKKKTDLEPLLKLLKQK